MAEKYVVIEVQTNKDGTVGTLVDTYDSWNVAEQKYHAILSAAAVSELPVHSAALLTNAGILKESMVFWHDPPVI